MNKKKWKQLEDIVDQALTLRGSERTTFIDKKCKGNRQLKSEVTDLLESIEKSEGYLENTSSGLSSYFRSLTPDISISGNSSLIGQQIGAYRISELIGYGGMGSVFKAERSDGSFDHTVALKIIRRGMDTPSNVARFKREQQILAGLNHPNIARLYDGGVTQDGLPYLIMEYIDGKPITEYCDDNRLTIDERIKLFKQVCRTVQYAHSNLIIHRDLKPDNILVTSEGQIKILDFGIAKLMESEIGSIALPTHKGSPILTLSYAAPEQVTGDSLTTATDIYALGVLFYQILTGIHPFDFKGKKVALIEQEITSKTPEKPDQRYCNLSGKLQQKVAENRSTTSSAIRQELQSDLEAIVLKTLRKPADARYSSTAELIKDLDYFQNNLPVLARSDSFRYHLSKFLRRHRVGIAVATCMFLLVTGLVFYHTWQITEQRNQAQVEAQKAAQVTTFLIDLFEANDPTEAQGDTITARELLARAEKRVSDLQGQPEVQGQMFGITGQIFRRLGNYGQSRKSLKRSVALRKQIYGPAHSETIESINQLGLLLCDQGNYAVADSMLSTALELQESSFNSNNLSLALTQNTLAYALRRQGYYNRAETLYRRSLQTRQKVLGPDHPLAIESLSGLGASLHNQGDYKATEHIFKEVLKRRRALLGPMHPDVAMSINNLAALQMNLGRYDEAEPLFREALTKRKSIYGALHPKVALTMNNLAITLRDQQKYAASERYFKQALQMRSQLFGLNNVGTAISMYSLGNLMLKTNRPDSALALYQIAYDVFGDRLSENHSFTARSVMGMGSSYLAKGELSRAEQYLTKGFEQLQQIHPETSLERALAEQQYGEYLIRQGLYNEADSLLKHALYTLEIIEGRPSLRQDNIRNQINQLIRIRQTQAENLTGK